MCTSLSFYLRAAAKRSGLRGMRFAGITQPTPDAACQDAARGLVAQLGRQRLASIDGERLVTHSVKKEMIDDPRMSAHGVAEVAGTPDVNMADAGERGAAPTPLANSDEIRAEGMEVEACTVSPVPCLYTVSRDASIQPENPSETERHLRRRL